MANLFKGMTGQQALQTGSGFLQMGLGFMQQQQQLQFEKQKFDLLKTLEAQKFKLDLDRLKLEQEKLKLVKEEAAVGKEEKRQRLDILLPSGRRPMGPEGKSTKWLPMADRMRQAGLMQLAQTGKMPTGLLKETKPVTLAPEEILVHPTTGKEIARGLKKTEKISYARYKSAQNGIFDLETNKWIVKPNDEKGKVKFTDYLTAINRLSKQDIDLTVERNRPSGKRGLFGMGWVPDVTELLVPFEAYELMGGTAFDIAPRIKSVIENNPSIPVIDFYYAIDVLKTKNISDAKKIDILKAKGFSDELITKLKQIIGI